MKKLETANKHDDIATTYLYIILEVKKFWVKVI